MDERRKDYLAIMEVFVTCTQAIDGKKIPEGQGWITGVPEMFVIDKQRVLVKKVIGPKTWDSSEAISLLEGLMK